MKKIIFPFLALVFSSAAHAIDIVVTVDSTRQQKVTGFGAAACDGAMCPYADDTQPVKLLYGKDSPIGLNIMRIEISPNFKGDLTYEDVGWDTPYDWHGSLPCAKEAKQRGALVFGTPWSPPGDFKTNGTAQGGNSEAQGYQRGELRTDKYADFFPWINSFLGYMKSNGVDIDAVSVQNEPDWWVSYSGCLYTPQQQVNLVKNYAHMLDRQTYPNVRLISAEPLGFNPQYSDALMNDATARNQIDIIAGHIYGHPPLGNMKQAAVLAARYGKEVWMTEHSATDNIDHLPYWSDQLKFAEELNECMLAGGTGYIHWYMRAHWSFVGTGETQYNPGNTKNQLLPRAYVMSHFSKHVTGSTRLGTTASVTTGTESEYEFSAYIKGDSLIVMAINTTGNAYNLDVKLPYMVKSGVRLLSTSNESLCVQSPITIAEPTKELVVTLPAQSLATLIFTIDNNHFLEAEVGDDIVNYIPKAWEGQSNTYGGLGHTAYERYQSGSIGKGDVLTQTLTGVKSGTYDVTLELAGSFTPDRGFECPTGTGYSLAFANNQYRDLEVVRRDWVSSVQPITISCTVGDDKTLKYGIYNIANGGNWYVANVTSIKYVSANTDNTFNINASAQHGTIMASTTKTAAGTTVTLSATPDALYQFYSYTVTTCTGENVTLNGNTFVMPAADVTVTANFSLGYQEDDDIVALAPTDWEGQTGTYSGLGYTVSERYKHGGDNGAGDVLTQTLTGLKNGVYAVTLELAASFTSGRGFDCPTGDGLSVAFANQSQTNLEVIDRQGVGSVTPITIYATVTDGTLKYGIKNLQVSGNWYIANVTGIKYISENATLSHELTVSSAGLATLYLPFDAAIPEADFFVVVAVKEISGSTAHLKRVRGDVLPANTGVMIYANEGTYSLPLATTASTENVESLLHGVLEDTPVTTLVAQEGKSIYVLSRGVKEYVGFKRLSGNGSVTYIPANRAYLPFSTSSQVNFINVSFGDTPTDIDALKISIEDDSDEIYDLTGRKVTAPQKGIYIVNGKKVLYK